MSEVSGGDADVEWVDTACGDGWMWCEAGCEGAGCVGGVDAGDEAVGMVREMVCLISDESVTYVESMY